MNVSAKVFEQRKNGLDPESSQPEKDENLDERMKQVFLSLVEIITVKPENNFDKNLSNFIHFLKIDIESIKESIASLKNIIEDLNNDESRNILLEKIELIEKSFLILQIIKEKVIVEKNKLDGKGINRDDYWLNKIATGAVPGTSALFTAGFSGMGEKSLFLGAGVAVAGFLSGLFRSELKKYQLMKKISKITKTGNLEVNEQSFLDIVNEWEKHYKEQKKDLTEVLKNSKIWTEYHKGEGDFLIKEKSFIKVIQNIINDLKK